MSRPFSLRRSSSVFIRAMLCALLLPVCVAVSAQTNRPAATQEGRQPALDPKVEKLARLVTIYRDSFGVPHIFGKTDAGVVFGMRSVGWLDFTEEFGMVPSCVAESSPKAEGGFRMIEAVREATDCIRRGNLIECSAEYYRSEIRNALIRFALACVDNNDLVRMRIALAEVNRLSGASAKSMQL